MPILDEAINVEQLRKWNGQWGSVSTFKCDRLPPGGKAIEETDRTEKMET
jgi:hypothetical protein